MDVDSRASRLSNPNILKSWKLRATLVIGLIAATGLSACQGTSSANEALPSPEPTIPPSKLQVPGLKIYGPYAPVNNNQVAHIMPDMDYLTESNILGQPSLKPGLQKPNVNDAVNALVADMEGETKVTVPLQPRIEAAACITDDNLTKIEPNGELILRRDNMLIIFERCLDILKTGAIWPTATPTPTETPTPTMTPEPSATPTPTPVPPPGFVRDITNTYDWAVDMFKRNAQMNPLSWLSYGAAGHLLRQVNEIFSGNYNFKIVDISILLGPLNLLIGFLQLLGNGLRILGNSLYENADRNKDK